jgi:type IV secretion system protein VirB8
MQQADMPIPALVEDAGARDWEYHAHAAIEVERNRWFVAAMAAGLLATAAIVALAVLLPLEKLVPLAVTVDSRTGLVTSVEYGRTAQELTQKEAVQRSDVAKYVVARETYDPLDLATNAKLVRVMSDGSVLRQYEDEAGQHNESSAIRRYGPKVRRRVEVSTVLPLPNAENTYQVRYLAFEEMPGAHAAPLERAYVATVRFRYSDRPLSNEDRILNPLNFRAVAYRKDQEFLQNKGGSQ